MLQIVICVMTLVIFNLTLDKVDNESLLGDSWDQNNPQIALNCILQSQDQTGFPPGIPWHQEEGFHLHMSCICYNLLGMEHCRFLQCNLIDIETNKVKVAGQKRQQVKWWVPSSVQFPFGFPVVVDTGVCVVEPVDGLPQPTSTASLHSDVAGSKASPSGQEKTCISSNRQIINRLQFEGWG